MNKIRELVKMYGGTFHGPRVETLSMSEDDFFKMMQLFDEDKVCLLVDLEKLKNELLNASYILDHCNEIADIVRRAL